MIPKQKKYPLFPMGNLASWEKWFAWIAEVDVMLAHCGEPPFRDKYPKDWEGALETLEIMKEREKNKLDYIVWC